MKKIYLLLVCMVIVLSGCALSGTDNVKGENIAKDEAFVEVEKQIKSLDTVNKDFQEVMSIGNNLISELNGITSSNEYSALVKADNYVIEMKEYYSDLLDFCDKNDDLAGMTFQLRILDHSCPDPITGKDSASINNQKILYKLHLKQLSSSFTYLSEYMDYLAGNRPKPEGVSYFKELPEMPTPNTVMYEISYDSEKTESRVKQYMYLIGDTEEDANMNYNAYIVALGTIDGISVEITSNVVYVFKNGTMVSAMMAGTDPVKGMFMIVSFQEQ